MSLVPEESAPPQDVRERAPFALTSTLPPGSFEQITRLSVLCLCGVTFAVFAQGLFGSFVWDDLFLIVQNRHVREGGVLEAFSSDFWHISSAIGAEVAYYRPLVTLSYVLEWRLYGDRPFGYHVTNLALHLVCVWLAFKWLYARLSTEHQVERAWQALAGAMAGALLFAVHPSRVEVVSWISGRTDSMMAALVLLGLVLFQRSQLRLRGLAAGVAFALALLCKEAMITVPVCLALDALLREPPERRREALRQAGSALGVTLLALALRFAFAPAPAHNTRSIFAQPLERVASTIGHYAESVLWPVHPSMLTALQRYDATGRIAYSQSSIVLGTLCVLALLGLLWA
ncbi:MAG TPA: hypothetical protein VHM19_18275, partial [Polyangiales bacterium]|nr:hypothetical protein [Polyangiales bacterium]